MRRDKGWRFILPVVILLIAITLFPFAFSVYISLTESTAYNVYNGRFIWFGNYVQLFKDVKFWDSLKVSFLYVLISVSVEMVLGISLALLVDSIPKGARIFMVLLIMPMMIAPLVYGIIFKLAYNSIYGVIPVFFRDVLGMEVGFLNKPFPALLSMTVVDAFQWTSFVFLIVYSALQALPRDPVEAAKIDGASYWQTVFHVILPMIKPAIIVALIFRAIDAFRTFDQIFVITGGGPGTATTTLSLYTYFLMFTRYDFGRAAALTVIILLIVSIMSKRIFSILYRGGES